MDRYRGRFNPEEEEDLEGEGKRAKVTAKKVETHPVQSLQHPEPSLQTSHAAGAEVHPGMELTAQAPGSVEELQKPQMAGSPVHARVFLRWEVRSGRWEVGGGRWRKEQRKEGIVEDKVQYWYEPEELRASNDKSQDPTRDVLTDIVERVVKVVLRLGWG